MADVSLSLNTNEYPLTVVDGTTLTLSLNGASGPSGPTGATGPTGGVSSVAGRTGVVTLASADITDATNAANPNTLVKRNAQGGAAFTGTSGFGLESYSDSGIGAIFDSETNTGASITSGTGTYHAQFGSSGVDQSFVGRVKGAFGWIRGAFTGRIQAADTLTANQTYTLPDLTGTVALTDAAQSWSGTQTFSGAMVFTNAARPTSSASGSPEATSLITRNDGDVRYSRIQEATVDTVETTGTNTTTYIDSTQGQLGLAVGTYIIETWQQVEGTGAHPSGCSAKTKLRWTGTATSSGLRFMAGTSTVSPFNQNAFPVMSQSGARVFNTEVMYNYNTNYGGINHLRFKFVVTVAGTLYIQFAPAAAVAGQLCSLHAGSFIRATQIA